MASGLYELKIISPEGVPLTFTTASAGERMGAFMLDCLFFFLGVAVPVIGSAVVASWADAHAVGAMFGKSLWLLFPFYFVFFEVRNHGRSPGKRVLGIRTIDVAGQALSNGAILTRNLTRFFETILPLLMLIIGPAAYADYPAWAALLGLGWFALLLFLPLLNRRRQRVGDFMGNTMVVRAPKTSLARDLTARKSVASSGGSAKGPAFRYTFTPDELALYGIFELQRLEELLRTKDAKRETLDKVKDTILHKMSREPDRRSEIHTRRFLQDLYAQLRRSLEQKMLFGTRQERKKKGRLKVQSPKSPSPLRDLRSGRPGADGDTDGDPR